jgi:hypothetical protein
LARRTPAGSPRPEAEVYLARIKDEFDRLIPRCAVDAGQVALPAVAVLASGQRTVHRAVL